MTDRKTNNPHTYVAKGTIETKGQRLRLDVRTTAQPKASNYTRFNSASFVFLSLTHSLTISLVAEREDKRASEIKDRQKPEKEKG
jgi:hypothetical protein